jgi:signal transduction histidine kinase
MLAKTELDLNSLSNFWLIIGQDFSIQSCSSYYQTIGCRSAQFSEFFEFIQPLVNFKEDRPDTALKGKILQINLKTTNVNFRFTAHQNEDQTILLGWPSFSNLEEIQKSQLASLMRHPACQITDILILKDVLKNTQVTLRNLEVERYREELDVQARIAQHQSKLASIGELTAGIAHEINNPLAVSMGLTELIKKIIQKENFSKEKALEQLEKQKTAQNRIRNIVQGLRTYARIDTIELEVFSLPEIINETLNLTEELFKKDQIEIEYKREQPECLIQGVRGELQQVLVNLLSNSKHALEGRESKKVSIQLEDVSSDTVQMTVNDNGAGMPPEIVQKIFTPFFTTKSAGSGTGLGLAITQKIIKKIGGNIGVKSTLGAGTSFVITFPRQKLNQNGDSHAS